MLGVAEQLLGTPLRAVQVAKPAHQDESIVAEAVKFFFVSVNSIIQTTGNLDQPALGMNRAKALKYLLFPVGDDHHPRPRPRLSKRCTQLIAQAVLFGQPGQYRLRD